MSFPNFLATEAKPYIGGEIRKPLLNYHSWAPWVRVTFQDEEGEEITVGNESSPQTKNTAVIKSFNYSFKGSTGQSGGCAVAVEIHDIRGGDFATFFDRLDKTRFNKVAENYKMRIQFGWVGVDCEDNTSTPVAGVNSSNILSSIKIHFLPLFIGTNYEGGKIKFTIEGHDMMVRVMEESEDKAFGSEEPTDKAMSMRQAIINMFKERDIDVEFSRLTDSGSLEPVGFMPGVNPEPDGLPPAGSYGGAISVYKVQNKSPFRAAMEWLKDVGTYPDNRPLKPAWNNCKERPTLVFLEDSTPECDCEYKPQLSKGTWIVNAGNNSPVISFNPNIKWVVNKGSPGGGGNVPGPEGGASTTTEENQNPKCKDMLPGTGIASFPITTENSEKQEGIKAVEKTAERNNNLTRAWVTNSTIEAQLVVQGAPEFSCPTEICNGSTFSIIVVNPYHYGSEEGTPEAYSNTCGDWSTGHPMVNPYFSNKGWVIMGVNHQIKEGSFQTTFDLMLPVPNSDIGKDNVVGCRGSGGQKLK